jgi:hypothetical protein
LAAIYEFQFTELLKVTGERGPAFLGEGSLGVTVFSKRRQMQLAQTILELGRSPTHEATS